MQCPKCGTYISEFPVEEEIIEIDEKGKVHGNVQFLEKLKKSKIRDTEGPY